MTDDKRRLGKVADYVGSNDFEYYDLATRILQCLEDLKTSLAAYDTSIVNMKRQHNRLLASIASRSRFDLGRDGVISVPQSEISNLADASFSISKMLL